MGDGRWGFGAMLAWVGGVVGVKGMHVEWGIGMNGQVHPRRVIVPGYKESHADYCIGIASRGGVDQRWQSHRPLPPFPQEVALPQMLPECGHPSPAARSLAHELEQLWPLPSQL